MLKFHNLLTDYGPKILGGKKYNKWQKERFKLQSVEIKNKKLAQELEHECRKNGGFLTYSEYINIEQFGLHGYHATHTSHGFTTSFSLWPKAILQYLKKHSITSIIELGPGDGKLFHKLAILAEKEGYRFTWYGIEKVAAFREKILSQVKNKDYIGGIFETEEKLPRLENTLILSSYCLDSIPPEILINTSLKEGAANSVIGIQIEGGILQEFVLTEAQLEEKGLKLKNGKFTKNHISLDFSKWKLSHMKRVYYHVDSFEKLYKVIDKTKKSHLLLIDEVRESIYESFKSDIIFPPLFLSVKNRYAFSPATSYNRAGELLYYYPIFVPFTKIFLLNSGFQNISCNFETKAALEIIGEKWTARKNMRHLCFAITSRSSNPLPTHINCVIPFV